MNATNALLPLAGPYKQMSKDIVASTDYVRLSEAGGKIVSRSIEIADKLFFKTAEAAFTSVVVSKTVFYELVTGGTQHIGGDGIVSSAILDANS